MSADRTVNSLVLRSLARDVIEQAPDLARQIRAGGSVGVPDEGIGAELLLLSPCERLYIAAYCQGHDDGQRDLAADIDRMRAGSQSPTVTRWHRVRDLLIGLLVIGAAMAVIAAGDGWIRAEAEAAQTTFRP